MGNKLLCAVMSFHDMKWKRLSTLRQAKKNTNTISRISGGKKVELISSGTQSLTCRKFRKSRHQNTLFANSSLLSALWHFDKSLIRHWVQELNKILLLSNTIQLFLFACTDNFVEFWIIMNSSSKSTPRPKWNKFANYYFQTWEPKDERIFWTRSHFLTESKLLLVTPCYLSLWLLSSYDRTPIWILVPIFNILLST